MIEEKGKIWLNGALVDHGDAKIHVLTHGLHYGTGVFEGMRCYRTADGNSAIFRLQDHMQRLIDSGRIYFMDLGFSRQQLEQAAIETVKANGMDECYIRPIAFYGYGKMGVNPMPNKVSVAIAVWKWDEYIKGSGEEKGARLMVSSWARLDPRTMPMHAKATANYANSALARVEAIKAGFDEAIMLNPSGMVVEASAENIFIVEKDGSLATPPTSSGALAGITRESVITIARENGIPCEERNISRDELYVADEVFLTGTAAEIKPVGEIDNRTIGRDGGRPGRVTKQLKALFDAVVHGKDGKFSKKWLAPVS
ncbi:branched-chain amino acid transaminase [Nitrososphaera viennensis]|uniref:Branched-chain-amino-acid aminotransferase n=2 Tax=Nitrososphaera viennensis TaxID=1034015 RepID=A0A060HII9_9ARCH|nr:branched-chain amino acid transaminase [Nitrososphaera viennensis]AIC16374.1 branched-chain amino-acid aminotransferase [Nitrososphaera viennensis EN76]UVS68310.1 branched-chain amino acid transaminase [Nitrososphaera viennensis]